MLAGVILFGVGSEGLGFFCGLGGLKDVEANNVHDILRKGVWRRTFFDVRFLWVMTFVFWE